MRVVSALSARVVPPVRHNETEDSSNVLSYPKVTIPVNSERRECWMSANLADCLTTIGKFYMKKATETEFTHALESTVTCPSCSASFQLVDAVRMDGGNMSIVCPSCGSLEARFQTV